MRFPFGYRPWAAGLLAVLAAGLPLAVQAFDGEQPVDVTCSDLTIYAPDTGSALSPVNVSAAALLQQCHSVSGQSLYLVSPIAGMTTELEAGGMQVQTFVVSNTSGEQASAKVRAIRQ